METNKEISHFNIEEDKKMNDCSEKDDSLEKNLDKLFKE